MECSICLDILDNQDSIKLSNCNHTFHKSCINQWAKNHNTCPLCRTNISNFFFAKTNMIMQIITKDIIIEVKEDKILFYNNIKDFKIDEDRDKLKEILSISLTQIKQLKVIDKICKINYLKINENSFKNKKKNIIFTTNSLAISFFETIKRIIIQYQRKLNLQLFI